MDNKEYINNDSKPLSEYTYEELLERLLNDRKFIDSVKKEIIQDLIKTYESYPLKELVHDVYMCKKDEMTDFSDYDIVSNIGEVLENLGWSVSELQRRTRIANSTLRSIINNTNSVSLRNAFVISKVTDVPIQQLFIFIKRK